MISYLHGILVHKSPTRLVVDGPKKAQVILSSVAASQLQRYILEENLTALTSLSGVGKKTAQRLILDLKDKVVSIGDDVDRLPGKSEELPTIDNLIEEAVAALTSLGFNKNSAQIVVLKVVQRNNQDISLEELIKQALQKL